MLKKFAVIAILAASLIGGSLFLVSSPKVSAAVDPACDTSIHFLGLPTWYKYLDVGPTDTGPCEIQFPQAQGGGTDLSKVVIPVAMAIFEIVLRVAGIAAVGFIIVGGFQYLISQGDPERTKGAKSTILNAIIGLVITMSAVVVVNLIGRNI